MIHPNDGTSDKGTILTLESMRARAKAGELVRAEDYLAPDSDPEQVLDIIYAEYVVRCETEGPPPLTELESRFPHLAERIRRQIEFHQAMESEAPTSSYEGASASTPAEPRGDEDPAHIGRYRVLNRLGRGGQATAYRAFHPDLEKDVVIKLGHQPAGLEFEMLRAEAKLLASLDHPGLARVRDFDRHEGRPFIVMDYVNGRPLDLAVKASALTPQQAAELTAQAAAAIAYAHGRGAIHRDLKPENLLIDERGHVCVIDFGLAKLLGSGELPDDDSGMVTGTLRYMAPEQARGEDSRIGPPTDVFGLGAVLYFLLTGSSLYAGSRMVAWELAKDCGWDRSKLASPAIPAKIRAVCEKALAREPGDRYPTAAALAADLANTTRKPLWQIPVAIIAVLVAIGLTIAFWPTAPSNLGVNPNPGNPTPVQPPNPAPKPALHFAVDVYRKSRFHDTMPVPFSVGEEIRFRGTIPANSHAALFLATESGKAQELAKFTPEATERQIAYPPTPAPGKAGLLKLTPPAGTHVVLFVASSAGPIAAESLGLAGEKWARPSYDSVIRVVGGRAVVEVRGRDVATGGVVEDPEGDVVARLTRMLQAVPEAIIEGVAFAVKER